MTAAQPALELACTRQHRLQARATRIAFLITGLAMSAWAPLIPFAQARLQVNDATLGLLLLFFGSGSLIAMPLASNWAARFGCRKVIVSALALMTFSLINLAFADHILSLAITLLLFGFTLGVTDVAMNIQAVIIEQKSAKPLMSGFHGFYSLGGILGAASVSLLLNLQLSPLVSLLIFVPLLWALLALASPNLLARNTDYSSEKPAFFVLPRGKVLLLGALCFIAFLAEGAILDWGALFLTQYQQVATNSGGLGYATFSIAMTLARLTGDKVVAHLGSQKILLLGGSLAALGFIWVLFIPSTALAFFGFILIGLGCSNIVPVLFSAAGKQSSMPVGLAISAVVTLGYAGLLAGPALIGFAAQLTSLKIALVFVAIGTFAIVIKAKTATAN